MEPTKTIVIPLPIICALSTHEFQVPGCQMEVKRFQFRAVVTRNIQILVAKIHKRYAFYAYFLLKIPAAQVAPAEVGRKWQQLHRFRIVLMCALFHNPFHFKK